VDHHVQGPVHLDRVFLEGNETDIPGDAQLRRQPP
jgi:hypothetical protein